MNSVVCRVTRSSVRPAALGCSCRTAVCTPRGARARLRTGSCKSSCRRRMPPRTLRPRRAAEARQSRSTSHSSISSRATAAGPMAGACPSRSAAVTASPVQPIAPCTQERAAVSKPNRQTSRPDEGSKQPSPPPSLAVAMNMLAVLNERLDQNLAHLSALACALGGARPGEALAASTHAPAPVGFAREFVDHLRAAHRRIDEIEHAAQRLANAIDG